MTTPYQRASDKWASVPDVLPVDLHDFSLSENKRLVVMVKDLATLLRQVLKSLPDSDSRKIAAKDFLERKKLMGDPL